METGAKTRVPKLSFFNGWAPQLSARVTLLPSRGLAWFVMYTDSGHFKRAGIDQFTHCLLRLLATYKE